MFFRKKCNNCKCELIPSETVVVNNYLKFRGKTYYCLDCVREINDYAGLTWDLKVALDRIFQEVYKELHACNFSFDETFDKEEKLYGLSLKIKEIIFNPGRKIEID